MFQSAKEKLFKSKKQAVLAALSVASVISGSAFATGPDFSSLTNSVDWTTVTAAVLLIAAGMAGLDIVIKGAKIILRTIRGA